MLVVFTTITAAIAAWWWPSSIPVVLLTAAPSLIIQAVALRCVYGSEARRWFAGGEADRMDGSA